ncbi:MAG: hypothetical protein H6746_18465 [Deltaproteobacteria bacterium]|nr:hypothetical protein [Deltaproteobacteria bacterium]
MTARARLATALVLGWAACAAPERRPAEPVEPAACAPPTGALAERIRTIVAAPTVRARLRPAAGQDPRRLAGAVAARLAQAGGDVLESEVASGELRMRLRLRESTPDAFRALLAPGEFGIHPVDDAAVRAMAERIRTRLVLAPELRLERWDDGPAEVVGEDREALDRFIADLPRPEGSRWVLMDTAALGGPSTWRAMLVGPARFSGEDLDRCAVGVESGPGTPPQLVLALGAQAAPGFTAWTGDRVGQRIAFVVDGAVIAAPQVQEAVPGRRLVFSGTAPGAVETVAVLLRGGPLDARPELVDFLVDMTRAAPTR